MKVKAEDGKFLVKYVRQIIQNHFGGSMPEIPDDKKEFLSQKRGLYVLFRNYHGKRLRGSAGYPEGIMEIKDFINELTISAATRDKRYPPLRREDLDSVIIEISILSEPELLEVENPEKYSERIKIGRDGVMVKRGGYKGVMLPQIPVEQRWSSQELLAMTSLKAGLEADEYRYPETEVYVFQAEVFTEEEPEGKIIKREF